MSRRKKIAYLGPGKDSFGFQALSSYFKGWKIHPVESSSHRDICQKVGQMQVDFGVVAVENVIDGVVSETVRSVEHTDAQFGVKICGEEIVTIDMRLIAMNGVTLDGIKRIVSHQVGINQCAQSVDQLCENGIEVVIVNSTAEAARIASVDSTIAALASPHALRSYNNLHDLGGRNMVDHRNSKTRFWILSKKQGRFISGRNFRTCFLANFEHDSVGVVYKTLKLFAKKDISVLLIHPSPIRGKEWEYTFVIEVDGYISDLKIRSVWDEFCALGISLQPLRFLGPYESKAFSP